jgi:CBS-domain-containing membrane protein
MISQSKYVVDVMTPNPVLVGPETAVWIAECLAQRKGVHELLVVNGYHLTGVVCRCDLSRADADSAVRDCMRGPPITIDDQDTAIAAEQLMERSAVGCLPVVDWAGCLRGIVTRHDLVAAGVLSASQVRGCASCGSSHGLFALPCDPDAEFCVRCLEQSRQPRNEVEQEYFTIGGGD